MAGSKPRYRYWPGPFNVLSILVASLLLVASGLGLREYMANRLTVVNASGQTVQWLTITVGKRPIRFENIHPGATVSGPPGEAIPVQKRVQTMSRLFKSRWHSLLHFVF